MDKKRNRLIVGLGTMLAAGESAVVAKKMGKGNLVFTKDGRKREEI